jgi:hypothetical protein
VRSAASMASAAARRFSITEPMRSASS